MKNDKEVKGLKKLRKITSEKPIHECSNCKCKRYSPCYCMQKENKNETKS
jgi:hypothetical protein